MNTVALRFSTLWLLVGWITIFLVGTDLFIVSPFLPAIGRDFGASPASLTELVSVFSITYALACPLQAKIAERIGIRQVLLFGIAAMGAANLYTALAHTLMHLNLSRIFAGLGAASISPMIYALTAERTPPEFRAGNLALVGSGLVIALIIGAPLGLLIGAQSSWRVAFKLLAVGFALLVPINSFIWQESGRTQPKVSVVDHERLIDAWVYFACMIAWAASVYATYTLLGTALSKEYHASVGDLAKTLAYFGIGAVMGGILGGKLADRVGPRNVVRLSFLLMSLTFGVAYFVYPQNMNLLLSINLFCISLVSYGFFPALQACAASQFVARRPTVLGLMSSSLYVGITIGSLVGAQVFEAAGMRFVLVFSAVVAISGLVVSTQIRSKTYA